MIQAGQKYTYEGEPVIAMEDATRGVVRVRRITASVPVTGLERAIYVAAERLVAAPMKYYSNQVPGDDA